MNCLLLSGEILLSPGEGVASPGWRGPAVSSGPGLLLGDSVRFRGPRVRGSRLPPAPSALLVPVSCWDHDLLRSPDGSQPGSAAPGNSLPWKHEGPPSLGSCFCFCPLLAQGGQTSAGPLANERGRPQRGQGFKCQTKSPDSKQHPCRGQEKRSSAPTREPCVT